MSYPTEGGAPENAVTPHCQCAPDTDCVREDGYCQCEFPHCATETGSGCYNPFCCCGATGFIPYGD